MVADTDIFWRQYSSFDGPATDGYAITTSNTVFTQPTRAIYVGVSGNVTVQMASTQSKPAASNTILTFANINAGTLLPIRVVSVFANSTANSIIGLF